MIKEEEAEKEFTSGVKALHEGKSLVALTCFEKAFGAGNRPAYASYLGLCIAKERGQVQKGMLLCREALEKEPEAADHYINLGKICLIAKNKEEAISIFRKGLQHGPNLEIIALLDQIGTRRRPPIPFLSRDNLLNKYLGKVLGKLGLR